MTDPELTIDIHEQWINHEKFEIQSYVARGKINSLNFKKGTMRVSYKDRFNKRKTQDFPISGFFHKYCIDFAC